MGKSKSLRVETGVVDGMYGCITVRDSGSELWPEMFGERGYSSGDSSSFLASICSQLCFRVAKVFPCIIHAPHLAARALGNIQKSGEIRIGSALKAFSNIIHYRNARPLNLITESLVVLPWRASSQIVIDFFNKCSCFLPDPQVFKVFGLFHRSPPVYGSYNSADSCSTYGIIPACEHTFNSLACCIFSSLLLRLSRIPSPTLRLFDHSTLRLFDFLTLSPASVTSQ